MRPIETEYRGITFRSRLEARWAVFFDNIEWPWLYESSSFDFNGRSYTPDFYLVCSGCYAEIKPFEPTGLEIQKARCVAKQTQGCFLIIGRPSLKPQWLLFGEDEKLVYLDDKFTLAAMDTAEDGYQYSNSYFRALDQALKYQFDGFDDDRETIKQRYI